MQLTKEAFQTQGVFTGRPVRKEITWKCGDEELSATTWIRMMSYLDVDSEIAAKGKRYSLAERIAGAVCDENGVPVFTVADITGEAEPGRGPLDAGLSMALLRAINEVWAGKQS